MQSIPPETVKWLTRDEVLHYWLTGKSPAVSDYEEAREARRLGISKPELLRRKAEANKRCAHLDDVFERAVCRNKITGWHKLIQEDMAKYDKLDRENAARSPAR